MKNLPVKTEPAEFQIESTLMFGLSAEQKDTIQKAVELAMRREIPNCGGEIPVLVLLEHTYTKSTIEATTAGEFIENVQTVEMPKYQKAADGTKTLMHENMIPTGRQTEDGKEIYKVKTTEIVKGWKQLRTLSAKVEQKTVVSYPYVMKVKNADDWSDILGRALKLHQQLIGIKDMENKVRKTGFFHAYMMVSGEGVGTKLVSSEGVPARLQFSDFKMFAKGLYRRLKQAIEMQTAKEIEAVKFD